MGKKTIASQYPILEEIPLTNDKSFEGNKISGN